MGVDKKRCQCRTPRGVEEEEEKREAGDQDQGTRACMHASLLWVGDVCVQESGRRGWRDVAERRHGGAIDRVRELVRARAH